ncbi:MAG: GNAT family N-acetyltransferase [Gammaproteobacteria bacterium]|nr:GNAT family N-acetyltransferase [Gammaproteobacteria bacterium]
MKIDNTQRLSFKLMDKDDANLFFELDQDPEVMRYINGGKVTSIEDIENILLPRLKSYTNAKKGWGLWKVTQLQTDNFIGWVLVRPVNFFNDNIELDNIELGWRFKQSSWGKGYGTEAAMAIKEMLIQNRGAQKITAFAFEENIGSIKIMTKLGMKYIKTDIIEDPVIDGELVIYELDVR